MKNKLIILTILLSIVIFGYEIKKSYSYYNEEWAILEDLTPLDKDNLSSFNGTYEIISFRRSNSNNSECISFIIDDNNINYENCSRQTPFEPLTIKGVVFLSYDKENNTMKVAYKYDMYEKDNTYFTKLDKSNDLKSYVYKGISDTTTFNNFELNNQINNSDSSSINIGNNILGNTIYNLQLTVNDSTITSGPTKYNFTIRKVNDGSLEKNEIKLYNNCLKDTHTPVDNSDVNKNFKLQLPINLNKEIVYSESMCKYGQAYPNDALGLLGYYKVTRMQIYNYDSYHSNINDSAIYDTDNREEGKRFKGEFWITIHPDKPLSLQNSYVDLQAAFKYQVENESKLSDINFPLTNTNNPLLLDISIPLQGGDYFIIDTFALVAQWDSASPQRTRQVIFKPEDKSNAVTFETGGKKYIAVLTLERLLNAFEEDISTPDGKINFFQDGTTTPITTPYWN